MARQKKEAPASPEGMTEERPSSQKEAVKRALKAKGMATPAGELADYIQTTFDMPIKPTNVSTLKSQIKREMRGRKKGPEGFTIEDLQLVRALVQRVGASRVRDMVELFDR